MKKEIVNTLIAVFIVQLVEGFDTARLQSEDSSSKTSVPKDEPKSIAHVYKEK